MPLVQSHLLHWFDEKIDEDTPRLGRHLELDGRSLAYTIEERVKDKAITIKPAEHLPNITTLDQGHLGSCTGNAGTYALGSLVGQSGIPAVTLDGKHLTSYDAKGNEEFAIALYHESTIQDGLQGTYPPEDNGSTGLGVVRALKAVGLVKGYLWATTARGFAVLLQTGGCMIGVPWYNGFFEPDVHGFIDHGSWEATGVAGGHELYVESLEGWDGRSPANSVIRVHNSWGDSWGDHGCGRMTLGTYTRLKNQIDVKALVAH